MNPNQNGPTSMEAEAGPATTVTDSPSTPAAQEREPSSPKERYRFLPMHEKVLADRGVDPQIAWDAGLRSLDLRSELVRKAFKEKAPGQPTYPSTALVIPSYSHDADGNRRQHLRLRWDESCYWIGTPGVDETSVPIPRYTTAKGHAPPPFIGPAVARVIADLTKPIYFTEAALKALALQTVGLDAIGLAGVEVGAKDPEFWGLTRSLSLHPDLKSIRWRDRIAYVSFDAGAAHNPMVALAQARLSFVIDQEGADVRIVRLPERECGADLDQLMWTEFADQGPDDFIHFRGVNAYRALVDRAVPGNPLRWVHQLIVTHADQTKDQIGTRLAALLREMQFVALLEVFPKATLDQVAKEFKRYAAIGTKALSEAVEQFAVRRAERTRDDQVNHPYAYVDGRTVLKQAPAHRVLAEFEAKIEREIMVDDGVEQTRTFEIVGAAPGGTKLPKLMVLA